MDDAAQVYRSKSLLDILVGVEAGVIGGLVTLLWFAVIMRLLGEPAWLIPNLYASSVVYHRSMLTGPGLPTWVGAAAHLTLAGIAGAVNGVLTPGSRLFALGFAAVCYIACYAFLWKKIAVFLPSHASQPILGIACFLYGSVLGWHPQLLNRARS